MRGIRWEHILIFILALTLCSELIWHVTPLSDLRPSFSLSVSKSGQKLIVDYSAHANGMLDMKILLIPVVEEPTPDMPVHVFYDPSYPAIGTSWDRVHMLWDNLKREMLLRGFKGKVDLVSAKEMEDLMYKKEKAVFVMASGGFPSNVFSRDKDLVRPWLESGGILLWFGWPPGYYTVNQGQVDNASFSLLPQHPFEEGVNRLGLGGLVRIPPFNGTLEVAEDPSYFSELLDINYNLIQYGLLTESLSQEGLVLGMIGGHPLRSSVSVISVGKGKIVVFGFFVLSSYILNGPELSGRDVAQTLDSGIIYASKTLMPVYEEHHLSIGESLHDKIEVNTDSSIKGVVVYVYSTTTSNFYLFHSEFIPNT
jgi:hypothetical protein